MKEKLKNYLINSLLILAILLVSYFGFNVFISGPNRAYEHEDKLYVEAFESYKDMNNLILLSRFSFDEVYYIVSDKGSTKIYWFNRDITKHGEYIYASDADVKAWAESKGYTNFVVSYGVYKESLVYVVKTQDQELFVSPDTYEVVMSLGV